MVADDTPVIIERRGHLGRIRLNRPQAINALTHEMLQQITDALLEWRYDPAVRTVLVTGEGDRGFCAGGDIVSLYRDATEGTGAKAARFFADEYRVNALIASYPKPYVAFMDGVVLGGGVGLSAHGSHRIVTETTTIGLPETRIGFVPDVGSTWLLSRAPGRLGEYVALTAGSVRSGDAIALGLADIHVPQRELPELAAALEEEPIGDAVAARATAAPSSSVLAARTWIDDAFVEEEVAGIVARLLSSAEDDARVAGEAIAANSPTALAATLESLRRAAQLPDLHSALQQEYRVSLAALAAPDFAEGVRARAIDKDRSPRWHPARSVSRVEVAHWFAPAPGGELLI